MLSVEFKSAIETELHNTYNAHRMQREMMVEHIEKYWDEWITNEREGWSRSAWDELANYIWVNFPGGTTAYNCADRIRKLVEDAQND